MADREGANEWQELGALKARHQASRTRAQTLADQMERENQALRDLIEAYKKADEALKRSRGA